MAKALTQAEIDQLVQESAADYADEKAERNRRMRSLIAQLGAAERWARVADRTAATHAARMAFEERFFTQVDPDGTLPPQERALRAAAARKAYFLRLTLASVQARRRGKGKR